MWVVGSLFRLDSRLWLVVWCFLIHNLEMNFANKVFICVFLLFTQRTQEKWNNMNYNEEIPFSNCWTWLKNYCQLLTDSETYQFWSRLAIFRLKKKLKVLEYWNSILHINSYVNILLRQQCDLAMKPLCYKFGVVCTSRAVLNSWWNYGLLLLENSLLMALWCRNM